MKLRACQTQEGQMSNIMFYQTVSENAEHYRILTPHSIIIIIIIIWSSCLLQQRSEVKPPVRQQGLDYFYLTYRGIILFWWSVFQPLQIWGVKISRSILSCEETSGHMKTLLLLYSCLCETPQETTQAHDNSTLKRTNLLLSRLFSCFLSNEQKYIPLHTLPPWKTKTKTSKLNLIVIHWSWAKIKPENEYATNIQLFSKKKQVGKINDINIFCKKKKKCWLCKSKHIRIAAEYLFIKELHFLFKMEVDS